MPFCGPVEMGCLALTPPEMGQWVWHHRSQQRGSELDGSLKLSKLLSKEGAGAGDCKLSHWEAFG